MQRGMIVSSLRQLVRRASVRPSMSGPWSYPLLNQCGYTTSRDDLLAAAYEVNHGTPFPDQKSQQALPPEPVAESALPKFDYASAAPTTASAGSGAVNGSIISKLRVEQGLPPDGSEDYSPNAATANFIAQQTALSSTASPTGVQEIAPAPSTDVNRSGAAPCASSSAGVVSEGVQSLRIVDVLEAEKLLSNKQARRLRWLAFSHPPMVSALR